MAGRQLGAALIALAATGCAGSDLDAQWLEGFGYGWAAFNHRVSYIHVDGAVDPPTVSVVGGTSTTGYVPDLPAGCDESSCDEFPFFDDADVTLATARATLRANRHAFGDGVASLVVPAAGASTELQVPLLGKVRGDAIALVTGFTVDTDVELGAGAPSSCYVPANGWHPRALQIAVGEPTVSDDGQTATVTVSATFAAGNSLEEARACVDEVAAFAQAAVDVHVAVIAADGDVAEVPIHQEASYAFDGSSGSPPEQPALSDAEIAAQLPLDPTTSAYGWSSLTFAFHVDDPEDRGAYLRTWSFDVDPGAGTAFGHATNYSPGTQLSGFDYTFDGVVRGVDVGVDVTRTAYASVIPVELDDQHDPVVFTLEP